MTMQTPDSPAPAVFTRAGIWHGMKLTAPYSISALPFGIAFGAAALGVSMSPGEAFLMSALAFAGSAQFAVLSLWGSPLPVAAIVLTSFLVNARHIVMGAAMHPFIANLPRRWVLPVSAGMTDAGWALTLQAMSNGRRDLGILLGTVIMQWPVWVGGTAIGALASSGGLDVKRWGLDVLIAGVFATSVVGLYRGKSDILPWIAAAAGTAAALLWIPGNWYILIGGLCAGLAGLLSSKVGDSRHD
jgi:predicted branched-subunit amino acid permease